MTRRILIAGLIRSRLSDIQPLQGRGTDGGRAMAGHPWRATGIGTAIAYIFANQLSATNVASQAIRPCIPTLAIQRWISVRCIADQAGSSRRVVGNVSSRTRLFTKGELRYFWRYALLTRAIVAGSVMGMARTERRRPST